MHSKRMRNSRLQRLVPLRLRTPRNRLLAPRVLLTETGAVTTRLLKVGKVKAGKVRADRVRADRAAVEVAETAEECESASRRHLARTKSALLSLRQTWRRCWI
jgi:hypothetical protein